MGRSFLTILTVLLIFNLFKLSAQDSELNNEKRLRFIGIEAGIGPLFCQTPEFKFIRGDVLPFSSAGASQSLSANMYISHVGMKAEFRNKSNRWGLLFGARYTRLNALLGKETNQSSSSSYFYVLDSQSGSTTEYLRVSEVSREIDYIGVPLEIRWRSGMQSLFKLYVKLGVEMNYKVNSSSDVSFRDDLMLPYKDNVLNKFKEPSPFFSTAYISAGLNFDKVPNIDLELILPYVLLTPEMTGILTSYSGMGVKVEIRLPF